MEDLAGKIRDADGFLFVTGEYNWGMQPGLKNLTDHYLEEWFWRPAAIVSYSGGRLSGVRSPTAWHGTLWEMGMVVISSTLAVGPIGQTRRPKAGRSVKVAKRSNTRSAFCRGSRMVGRGGKSQRKRKAPPY